MMLIIPGVLIQRWSPLKIFLLTFGLVSLIGAVVIVIQSVRGGGSKDKDRSPAKKLESFSTTALSEFPISIATTAVEEVNATAEELSKILQ